MLETVDGHRVVYDAAAAVRMLEQDRVVGIDSETTGLSPWRDKIATVQLYGDDTGTLALLRCPDGIPWPLREFLTRTKATFVVHNGVSFDIPFLHCNGVDVNRPTWYDTLVAETAVAATQRRNVSVSLRQSVRRRLGLEIDKDVQRSDWSNPDLTDQQVEYALRDVLSLPALRRAQLNRAAEAGVTVGLEVEQALVPVVAAMTITGLPLDMEEFWRYVYGLQDRRTIAEEKVREYLGEVNLRSPAKVAAAMVVAGAEPPRVLRELKTGRKLRYTTDNAALLDLERFGGQAGDVARALLDFRGPDQQLKVYDEEWVRRYVVDGVIHAKYWQCSTDTTRFSCSEPNLQQFPQSMRYLIGGVPGRSVVSADYSQIEIRCAAHISRDTALLAAIGKTDIHREIAATMFGVLPEAVTDEQRGLAKAVSFTLLFGGGPATVLDHANRSGSNLSESTAQGLINAFFYRFPGIKAMRDKAVVSARRGRPVTIRIPHGLKRTLFGGQVRPTRILNTAVQSTAASGIKYAMLEAHKRGLVVGRLGAQVHDELVAAFVPETEATEYVEELRECMMVGMARVGDFPVEVATKVGSHWQK